MEPTPAQRTASNLVLGTGFGLTGAGTVMLGVLLPELAKHWGFRDDTAGFLFFLQFIGASLGAVIVRSNHLRWLTIGYCLLAASACALALANLPFAFPAWFFFGLGLGTTMTSTSLIFVDRYRNDHAAKLQGLNFAWAIGATTAPILFLPYLRMATLRPLFLTLEGIFLALILWILLRERQAALLSQPEQAQLRPLKPRPQGALLPLVVLAICAVGIEASLSGWLTTYSNRADPSHTEGTVLAISLFWFGMTFSRFIFSTRLLSIVGTRRVMRLAVWCLAVSVCLLIGSHTTAAIRIGSALAGLSLGPLYPLALTFMLEFTDQGWIFAVGGAGAAVFPWLTGFLSERYGSLHYGLIAPCAAALLMATLNSMSLRPASPSTPAIAPQI